MIPAYVPVRPPRLKPFLARLIMSPPQRLLAPVRLLCPIPRAFGWAAVLRYDDVAEVLQRHDVFRVPFAAEISRLNDGDEPGTPFILGIDDERGHRRQLEDIMWAFPLSDTWRPSSPRSFASARKRLEAAQPGPFDAIPDLVTAVPLDICRDYYGVALEERERQTFAYAALELSGHLFGPPPIEPTAAGRENDAGAYVRAIVDRSIAREIAAPSGSETIVARLARRHRKRQARDSRDPDRHDHGIRADEHDGGRPYPGDAAAETGDAQGGAYRRGGRRRRPASALPVRGAALHADQPGSVPDLLARLHRRA